MPKREVSQAERAETPLTDLIANQQGLMDEISEMISSASSVLECDRRQATCALRDWMNYLIGQIQDAQMAEMRKETERLRSQLKKETHA